jgi:hypothetical protein
MAWVDSVPTLQVQLTDQQKADAAMQFALNAPPVAGMPALLGPP